MPSEGLKLEPVEGGFRVRIQVGSDRARYFVATADPRKALQRAAGMKRLGAHFRASGMPAGEIRGLLEHAGRIQDEQEFAAIVAEAGATKKPKPVPGRGETVAQYAERWFAERKRRGLSSVETDSQRLMRHVMPVLGGVLIAAVLPEDLRTVVERLDGTVRRGELHWNTAKKVWGLVTKMFSDACRSKVGALRVRADNPCASVAGPDRGDKKGKQWLYPSEVAALLACAEVPLRWRRLYALAAYLYLRPGELAALAWDSVNFEHGYVHIHQALDLRTGRVKSTKTGITRKVPIRPSLLPLLEAMYEECDGKGRVVHGQHENKEADHGFPPLEDLAATLRTHLARAGVKRSDLFEERATTKRVTFYDLRATGITWEVLDGTEHVRIMQRAGHLNFSTTQGYIREAEALGVNAGAPFGSLPHALLAADERGPEGGEGVAAGQSGAFSIGLRARSRMFMQHEEAEILPQTCASMRQPRFQIPLGTLKFGE